MFDYAQRLQLALKDTVRRSVIKAAAGVILVVAVGFLIASLWSFLAHNLRLGPTLASLIVGGIFVLIALILLAVAKRTKHEMPTKDDLRKEVEARISLARDAAVDKVRIEADRMLDRAGNKAASLMDQASYRANKLADDTERRVYGVARHAAETVGLTASNITTVRAKVDDAAETLSRANNSNAASIAKLIGAFAVGVTLAAKLKETRDGPDYEDDIL
ncbi:phage holin family protein [Paracoccus sediminis]|uniref:Phage holin family protein n=1 Tax=Paracoccus sediminis TaxID=1214787 RepID=A0A238X4C9_9RHOB|nr:phage holin family protein [Paracoccus sediminis]TBN49249.1 phage holin family protein [Paracoccus sediminis]SNR53492.1 Putative Holin-X, holin superfamily III [Paracoccus sediminis]